MTPSNIRSNFELGVQIVIAIAVVIIAGVAAKQYVSSRSVSPASAPRLRIGERLNVPNVKWEDNKKSLVFFLMKDCVYCASSAPFYRQLIDEALKRNVKLLAILPNSVDEARKYLKYLELPIENVQTGSLSSYKISGTPTVLFVDREGIVRSTWFGAAPEREKEMREQLVMLFER